MPKQTRMSAATKIKIYELYSNYDITQAQIAARFGVSESRVQQIISEFKKAPNATS